MPKDNFNLIYFVMGNLCFRIDIYSDMCYDDMEDERTDEMVDDLIDFLERKKR